MIADNFVNITLFGIVIPFITLFLTVLSLVILLECVWRVEKRLGTAFKLLAASVIIIVIRKALGMLGIGQSVVSNDILISMDMLSGIFSLLGFIEFGRIIRTLTYENKN